MSSSVQSLIDYGSNGLVVDIECHLSNNLPNIVIVGFANRAVDEARERVRGAFASAGLQLPRKRITINLAPADIPKDSSSFDLAIAAAIIQASPTHASKRKTPRIIPESIVITPRHSSALQSTSVLTSVQSDTINNLDDLRGLGTAGNLVVPAIQRPLTATEAVMGELGLDGIVRPVRGIIGKILAGRAHGITTFYIPDSNLPQAELIPNVTLIGLHSLAELAAHMAGTVELLAVNTSSAKHANTSLKATSHNTVDSPNGVSLHDVIGQQQSKRALEIVAAGGHNLLLSGPPGTGKSMLARALASIMPALTREEMLEVTHLHSLASKEYDRLIVTRPFRAPHHSTSHTAVIGGGSSIRPGEISLAHRGVLFFDEFPEFNRPTIEALRQPLEDRTITITRTKDSIQYPANFILIATANPCPCGYYGINNLTPTIRPASTLASVQVSASVSRHCDCAPAAIQRYRAKLSGPIMDRIDLYTDVYEVDHASLLASNDSMNTIVPNSGKRSDMRLNNATHLPEQSDDAVRRRVIAARKLQYKRHDGPNLNAGLTNRQLHSYAHLAPEAKDLLDTAGRNLALSARAYLRTVKVARTIADLAASRDITTEHITEALQYRCRS